MPNTREQGILLDVGDHLAEARHQAQVLANRLSGGDQNEVRVATTIDALVEAIKAAQAIKAIALGEVDEWLEEATRIR